MNKPLSRVFAVFGFAIALLIANPARADFTERDLLAFDNEPPVIADLLKRAVLLERDDTVFEGDWQAAKLYCQASRYGSAEAYFRLGILYAVGKGVPLNRDLAAALFAAASMQGHYESQKMLETVELVYVEMPPCVTSAVDPEKAIQMPPAETDTLIASLPQNKRWLLSLVDTIAGWYKVDSQLVLSIIAVESNFKIAAKSNKSAQGLMQLIPSTAERFNVKDAFNASQNIKGGVAYLRWLLAYFQGDVNLAVAAYNAGEGAVNKYKGIPPYAETKRYVQKVRATYPHARHPFDEKITTPSPILRR